MKLGDISWDAWPPFMIMSKDKTKQQKIYEEYLSIWDTDNDDCDSVVATQICNSQTLE